MGNLGYWIFLRLAIGYSITCCPRQLSPVPPPTGHSPHLNSGGSNPIPAGSNPKPDGSNPKPDGSNRKPGGTIRKPDATIRISIGSSRRPDGAIPKPDATIRISIGSSRKPDGTIPKPDATIRISIGSNRKPEGTNRIRFDPNQIGSAATGLRFDPSQIGFDVTGLRFDPNRIGFDPNRIGFDTTGFRFDPMGIGCDLNRIGLDPNRIGLDVTGLRFDSGEIGWDPSPAKPRWPALAPRRTATRVCSVRREPTGGTFETTGPDGPGGRRHRRSGGRVCIWNGASRTAPELPEIPSVERTESFQEEVNTARGLGIGGAVGVWTRGEAADHESLMCKGSQGRLRATSLGIAYWLDWILKSASSAESPSPPTHRQRAGSASLPARSA